MGATYPSHREVDVALRDGSTVHVRPVRPGDEAGLLALLRSLSQESLAQRFFSPAVNLEAMAHDEANVEYVHSYGLIAEAGTEARVVGHATYVATTENQAEVAFTINDTYQGRGLGTILLGQLAQAAEANGIHQFEAIVLPQNHRMIGVFRDSGFPLEVKAGFNEIVARFPTGLTEQGLERFERREQAGAIGALTAFLRPRSVAVIGASRQRGTVGGEAFHNLLAGEFAGPVYPVNPAADVVQCVPAFPSVEAIPGPVDLAVVVVPAERVPEVAEACGRKGVRALVVISAGFGEVGEAGRERQRELLRICRASGMRLIGPNCIGIANTDPEVRLNATFGPLAPPAGRVGFSSQSGALGLAAIDYAGSLGLGISSFVSVGNKADISGNDLLNYWEDDPRTDVILMYLESFGNPRKFVRVARRVGRSKPIIAVKSGRSTAGARATSSHTGALLAASDVPVDALFRQAGVIRTDTLEELFDVASLLANQPIPKGRRIGIVTNVGGPAILCADACEAEGLEIPLLANTTQAGLREFLPAEAAVANPVDMIASATPEHYRRAIELVGNDPGIDALVAIFLPPLATRVEDVATAIVTAAGRMNGEKTLLSVFMSSRGIPDELRTADLCIPSFPFPESAAIALAHAARYGEWRARPIEPAPALDGLRRDEAAAIVAVALGRGGGWLEPSELQELSACYGLPLVEQRVVSTPDEAGQAAAVMGGEVALKAIAAGLVHKTELGAVRLHLAGDEAVRDAATEMAARLSAAGLVPTGYQIQRMIPGGVEMLIGLTHDTQFGPLIACGAGGVNVELLKDVAVRLTPLSRTDAHDMLRDLKTYPLLDGYRGATTCDVAALEDALLRLSALAEDLPQVIELDCNPLIALEQGVAIADIRARVEPVDPPRPLGARR